MNPLQKKCVIATAGFHLLLLVILFLGPGFFHQRQPKPDKLPVLKFIPFSAVEADVTSGSAHNTPPPVAQTKPQPVAPPPPPAPEPAKVKPVVTPPVEPKPEVVKPVETKPVETKPVETKPEQVEPQPEPETVPDQPAPVPTPKPKRIEVSLVVHKKTNKPHPDTARAEEAAADAAAEKAERAAEKRRADAAQRLTESLRDNLTSDTEVSMPTGEHSQATANYGQIVKSIYYNEWIPPESADNEEASPKAHVVISRDGTVISAHIIDPSGDAAVDASVRQVLDRVKMIRPFADDALEQERSYTIIFDLKAKRKSE